MKKILSPYQIKKFTLAVIHSIAFYPAIIAIGFFFLAIGALYAEENFSFFKIVAELPFLAVSDVDTARSMLTTLAGGIISIMVFTFTMVMLVLNLTSTNYSPRVLPGLISSKPNQIVLGLFLGTISYTITILSNIDSDYYSFSVPKLALIINAVAGAACLAGFVYFIHHISRSIQISNMLVDLHRRTTKVLDHEAEYGNYLPAKMLPEIGDDNTLIRSNSGYLQALSEKNLVKLAKKHDLIIQIVVTKGMFVLNGQPVLKATAPLSDKLKDELMGCFVFQNEELISQNYLMGIKQITEIVVKAMSPGINDPGTALQGLNYLIDLFLYLDNVVGHKTIMEDGKFLLIYSKTPVCNTIRVSLLEILIYGKADLIIVHRMYSGLKLLESRVNTKEVKDCIEEMITQVEREIKRGEIKPYIKPFL
ncbi:MAG: DUF2254 domain-containing protein [Cyclobacteriaceae bacterium]